MKNKKVNEYSIICNYNNLGKEFKNIVQNHIKYLIKIPVRDWHLQEFDLKYK